MNAPATFPMDLTQGNFGRIHRDADLSPAPDVPVMFRLAEQREAKRMNAHAPHTAHRPTAQVIPGHRPFVTVGEALLSAFRQMPKSHPLNPAARDLDRRE